MGPAAALSGSFVELPLPDLLALLEGTRQTGVLEVQGAVRRRLVLVGGGLTLGLVDDGRSLEHVVRAAGVVDTPQWEAAQRALPGGSALADALVDAGVDPDRLRDVLLEQVVGTAFELLLSPEDAFAFLPGATHPLGSRWAFAGADVLAEAERRVQAWRVIAEVIPSTGAVLRLRPDAPPGPITVDADEWVVLARVDGRASVADIVAALGTSAFEVCSVLHRLVERGAVEHRPVR